MSELKLPSGRTFDADHLDLVCKMHRYGTVRYDDKPFPLKAGGKSNVYFVGREDLTYNPEYLADTAQAVMDYIYTMINESDLSVCLIGVPMAGAAIACAIAVFNHVHCDDEQFRFLMLRPVLKSHGANKTWVDGKPHADDLVITIENVRTTGTSENEALEHVGADGIPTEHVIRLALVDRKLRPETDTMKTVFYMADIITAFGHLGLWTPEQVERTLPEFLLTE